MSIAWQVYKNVKRRLPHQMQPYLLAHAAFHAACGGRVVSGPFKGMHYVRTSIESAYYAKLLGVYERELHDIIQQLSDHGFDRLIDIGAAEGYYAAGLAFLDQDIKVIAYEGDTRGQELQSKMIAANGLQDRFTQKGWCDADALGKALANCRNPLIIVDCEGAERTLLVPDQIPDLERATILVEVHDFAHPEVDLAQELRDRFSGTHHIHDVPMLPRQHTDFPTTGRWPLDSLSDATKAYLIDEGRPNDTPWVLFLPKHVDLDGISPKAAA